MRIGDWPSSPVMRIMSVELLTPARLVIEYPIMHYYGIPRDIQSMTGHDIIIHVWLRLSVFGNSRLYCIVGIFLIMHSPINMDSQKKVKSLRFCWRTCLLLAIKDCPAIGLFMTWNLTGTSGKKPSTPSPSLVQVIEGRATHIHGVQSFPLQVVSQHLNRERNVTIMWNCLHALIALFLHCHKMT